MSSQRLRTLATIALLGGGLALAGWIGPGLARLADRDARVRPPARRRPRGPRATPTRSPCSDIPARRARTPTRNRPSVEVRANSWATGTNPKVDSVYLTILAHNPAIKGHNSNYAEAGAERPSARGAGRQAPPEQPEGRAILIQTY